MYYVYNLFSEAYRCMQGVDVGFLCSAQRVVCEEKIVQRVEISGVGSTF